MTRHLLDAKGRPVVVVTGMGLVTSLGRGTAENWRALVEGRSGIKTITRFPTDGLRTTMPTTMMATARAPQMTGFVPVALAFGLGAAEGV